MQELRPVTPDEFESWLRAESRAHSNRLDHEPEELRPHFDLARSLAVFEGSNIIGGCQAHKLEMSIPGGTSAVAGVANVAVQPTHTRQGVMSRMMRRQMNDIHEWGEPLAALFASESAIYGRFGYGVGTVHESWQIDRHHTAYARKHESHGRIVFVDTKDAVKQLPEVYKRGTAGRPGVFPKPSHKWEEEAASPDAHEPQPRVRGRGRGGLFYAAYEQDGRIDGYAIYRSSRPTIMVTELMAATREAAFALWRFCFDLDLMSNTEAIKRPMDDPLPWMLLDPRRLQRTVRDGVWLRVVDARAALEQRNYAEAGRLTLEVRDDLCDWNNGRFELEGSADGATCRATDSSPDLSVAISGLASAYLGTVSFTTLSDAGLADEHTPGALHRADRMFAVQHQPWTPFNF
ncbi:MAG: GNAT family N-acetyltransferase [Chloroflexi bacterium]|nr:GNAT family N-acetyltransferase [Chloroflexota bacterium]MYE41017.1 GNAT family N-acetyltransferase [Chloroflexota bacterium]